MSTVFLNKCTSYSYDGIVSRLREGFQQLGGLSTFCKPGETVLVKPNLLWAGTPEQAISPHPALIQGLIEILKENGCSVIIGDSPGKGTAEKVLSKLGILSYIQSMNIPIADENQWCDIPVENGIVMKKITVFKTVHEVDKIISLAKVKTHALMTYTGAIKNLFGCIPGRLKPELHYVFPDKQDFAGMIVDVFKTVHPCFTVLDGITAMEGNGPGTGDPFPLHSLIMSGDLLAADVIAARLIGLNPDDIDILRIAGQHQSGAYYDTNITVIGTPAAGLTRKDFRICTTFNRMDRMFPLFNSFIKKIYVSKPKINHKKCIRCGDCVNVCYAQAVTLNDNKITFDYSKCIRCYCCQELCPAGAISKKKGPLMVLFEKVKKYL